MIGKPTFWKLVLRNLGRNKWRSILTGGGIAVAVGMMLWTMSFLNGWNNAMVQGSTALTSLQVEIERADYVEDSAIYKAFAVPDGFWERLGGSAEVQSATARVKLYGLVGNAERSQVAQIIGVDPAREKVATPIVRAVVGGAWLGEKAAHQMVLGDVLARQLRVAVGDKLVVFLEASDGSLGNDLMVVGGIVHTGNTALDRQAAYVHIADAQMLGALEGKVHEIAVRTGSPSRAEEVAVQVKQLVGAAGFAEPMSVRPWQQVQPQMANLMAASSRSNWILYVIIYLVASLGILNTQRMSALERRREFAVLMAIGVSPRLLFWIVLAETAVLGFVGAVLGGVLGAGLSWYHARVGINLAVFSSQTSFSYLGVSFSDRIYTSLDVVTVVQPVVIMLIVAFVCGLWPAVQSSRIEITQALSGRG